jgi:hypothetical protein
LLASELIALVARSGVVIDRPSLRRLLLLREHPSLVGVPMILAVTLGHLIWIFTSLR